MGSTRAPRVVFRAARKTGPCPRSGYLIMVQPRVALGQNAGNPSAPHEEGCSEVRSGPDANPDAARMRWDWGAAAPGGFQVVGGGALHHTRGGCAPLSTGHAPWTGLRQDRNQQQPCKPMFFHRPAISHNLNITRLVHGFAPPLPCQKLPFAIENDPLETERNRSYHRMLF